MTQVQAADAFSTQMMANRAKTIKKTEKSARLIFYH